MGPQRFRKRPVTVEAWRVPEWEASSDAVAFVDEVVALAEWCGGTSHLMDPPEGIERGVHIQTLDGVMVAREGDYVIRGTVGEFYPCKPEAFASTFEPAGD